MTTDTPPTEIERGPFKAMLVSYLADESSTLEQDFYENVELHDLADQAAVTMFKEGGGDHPLLEGALRQYMNRQDDPTEPTFPLQYRISSSDIEDRLDKAVKQGCEQFWRKSRNTSPRSTRRTSPTGTPGNSDKPCRRRSRGGSTLPPTRTSDASVHDYANQHRGDTMTTVRAIHESELRHKMIPLLEAYGPPYSLIDNIVGDYEELEDVETRVLAKQTAVLFVKHDVDGEDLLFEAVSTLLGIENSDTGVYPISVEVEGPDDVHEADEAARMAFWREIADRFPQATSGDLPPGVCREFREASIRAVEAWVDANVPNADLSESRG